MSLRIKRAILHISLVDFDLQKIFSANKCLSIKYNPSLTPLPESFRDPLSIHTDLLHFVRTSEAKQSRMTFGRMGEPTNALITIVSPSVEKGVDMENL